MKRRTKYVGLDVHQATTVASVREEGGRVIARTVVPTEEAALVEFFSVYDIATCGNAAPVQESLNSSDRDRLSRHHEIALRTGNQAC